MKLGRTAVGSPGRHGSAIPFTCAITLYETAKSRAGIIEIFQWAENNAVLDRSGNAKLPSGPYHCNFSSGRNLAAGKMICH